MNRLKIVKETLDGIESEIKQLIEENGPEMYHGAIELVNDLKTRDEMWLNLISSVESDFNDEDDDSFLDCVLVDCIDVEIMNLYGKQLYTNLINMGYEYDGDGWNIKSKFNGEDMTCYGVIWDYWYDLDTCVRERVSDVFELEIEGIED
jgi:hypothetical protein